MRSLEELDNNLYTLHPDLIEDVKSIDGDILILGAGGK
ncbi:MAG: epimerase, partial [Marivirga sp.]|nr:epimerase [Marivirga sp.]